MAAKIEIREHDPRTGKKCAPTLCLLDDERDEMSSIPLRDLAKALAPYLSVRTPEPCTSCGGRGVEDAHQTGDGDGGPCRHCNGTGEEKE